MRQAVRFLQRHCLFSGRHSSKILDYISKMIYPVKISIFSKCTHISSTPARIHLWCNFKRWSSQVQFLTSQDNAVSCPIPPTSTLHSLCLHIRSFGSRNMYTCSFRLYNEIQCSDTVHDNWVANSSHMLDWKEEGDSLSWNTTVTYHYVTFR